MTKATYTGRDWVYGSGNRVLRAYTLYYKHKTDRENWK